MSSTPFDPYYTWLGIPPTDQPPNHYRLLGIERFEAHPDVIENAAERQLTHLQRQKLSPHGTSVQQLCSEVTKAKLCLLDPDRKAAYDRSLRTPTTPLADSDQRVAASGSRGGKRWDWNHPAVLLSVAIGWTALLLVVVFLIRYRGPGAELTLQRTTAPPSTTTDDAAHRAVTAPERSKKAEDFPKDSEPLPTKRSAAQRSAGKGPPESDPDPAPTATPSAPFGVAEPDDPEPVPPEPSAADLVSDPFGTAEPNPFGVGSEEPPKSVPPRDSVPEPARPSFAPNEPRPDELNQSDEAALVKTLETEYLRLLKDDPLAPAMREAHQLLATTNQSSTWTNYSKAVAILRRQRSKTAVPLLLAYMLEHDSYSTSHVVIPAYVNTIELLTGEPIGNPQDARRSVNDRHGVMVAAVDKLVNDWWLPNRDTITTDVTRMSEQQLMTIVDRLVGESDLEYEVRGSGNEQLTAYRLNQMAIYELRRSSSSGRPNWYLEELHPRMTEMLLRRAGYVEDPASTPPPRVASMPFDIVPILTTLRINGMAPQLTDIVKNPQQSSAARLVSVLAMYSAGEVVHTPALLSILENETMMEFRLTATVMLMHSRQPKDVIPRVIELLDDPNVEMQTAAVYALQTEKPLEVLPKLGQMLQHSEQYNRLALLGLIASYKNRQAVDIIAEYLASAVEARDDDRIYRTLSAFEDVTDQDFFRAGARSREEYLESAESALQWWRQVAGGRE